MYVRMYCVCMYYVCMYVCTMYVCMYVRMWEPSQHLLLDTGKPRKKNLYVRTYVRMYCVYMYYVCMYVCTMHVCMYVRMYILCMYVQYYVYAGSEIGTHTGGHGSGHPWPADGSYSLTCQHLTYRQPIA
jgi:hypothetical protein